MGNSVGFYIGIMKKEIYMSKSVDHGNHLFCWNLLKFSCPFNSCSWYKITDKNVVRVMVVFVITGSARSWREVAACGPVRQNYPLVIIRQYLDFGSISFYWVSERFSFPKQIFFSCISFVPPHLYKTIAFANSQSWSQLESWCRRVRNPALSFDDGEIPFSCKSLKYFWLDILYHHFKIFSLHWGNVFIQPWISEISKILSIRTRAPSLSSLPLDLSSKLVL